MKIETERKLEIYKYAEIKYHTLKQPMDKRWNQGELENIKKWKHNIQKLMSNNSARRGNLKL